MGSSPTLGCLRIVMCAKSTRNASIHGHSCLQSIFPMSHDENAKSMLSRLSARIRLQERISAK